MAYIDDKSLQEYSYAGPGYHAPQIFREEIFARSRLTVSLSLDEDLFFLVEDYLVFFPSFFLRFNRDGSISFLADSIIQGYRRDIFGVPLHQVSEINTQEADVGCVTLRMNGKTFYLSTQDSEKYNRIFYGDTDYLSTICHFNLCVREYHKELDEVIQSGALFPLRELREKRTDRRKQLDQEMRELSERLREIDDELKQDKFSLSPLRFQERSRLKELREELKEKYQDCRSQYSLL